MTSFLNVRGGSIVEGVRLFLFFLVVFFLTRQVPFSEYSFIMNIALVGFVMFPLIQLAKLLIKRSELFPALIAQCFIVLFVLSLYSIVSGNDPSNIVRWLVIFTTLIIAYIVRPSEKFIVTFLILMLFQAVFIDAILALLISSFTLDSYSVIRQLFIENNWGDVYSFDGVFWFVKIRGSGLLPVGAFVAYIYLSGRKRIIALLVFLPSIIVSNTSFTFASLAFLIGMLVMRCRLSYTRVAVGMLTLMVFVLPLLYGYTNKVFTEKEGSMGMRYDQYEVLVNDLTKTDIGVLLGRGLGHTLSISSNLRDYAGDMYFEVQSLYVLNQLGVILFSLYVLLHFILAFRFIRDKELLLVYFCYVLYAISNPYIFDTSHFVVIVVLVSLRKVINESDLCGSGCLQPRFR